MKKIIKKILSVIMLICITSLIFGVGYINYSIFKSGQDTQVKLEELYQQNLILFDNIEITSRISSLNDIKIIDLIGELYISQNQKLSEKMTISKREVNQKFRIFKSLLESINKQNQTNKKNLTEKINDMHRQPSYEYLKSVTVRIFQGHSYLADYGWIGTGTVVKITDDYTYILTNKHVAPMDNKDNIHIESEKEMIKAEVLKNSAFEDLSLIRVVGKIENKQVINGISQAYPSNKVYSVGMYLGNYYIYTDGTYAGKQKDSILINAPSSFGCSGSGVFDREGNLIAVIYATNILRFVDTDSAKAVCVSSSAIRIFLKGII